MSRIEDWFFCFKPRESVKRARLLTLNCIPSFNKQRGFVTSIELKRRTAKVLVMNEIRFLVISLRLAEFECWPFFEFPKWKVDRWATKTNPSYYFLCWSVHVIIRHDVLLTFFTVSLTEEYPVTSHFSLAPSFQTMGCFLNKVASSSLVSAFLLVHGLGPTFSSPHSLTSHLLPRVIYIC